ncbi:MAG: DUF6883 domain-containing protein [Longimicrobiales bacterium]
MTNYLLSPTHPTGRAKAKFLFSLGFNQAEPELLAAAFRQLILGPAQVEAHDTSFGTKYIVNGDLVGPARHAPVRTVWIIERGTQLPRFVTAYPRT